MGAQRGIGARIARTLERTPTTGNRVRRGANLGLSYVLHFEEIDRTRVALVGGKGAHLGELSRIAGVRVPAGFCVTTDAFERIISGVASLDDLLDRLSRLRADDADEIRRLSAELRRIVAGVAVPDDLAAAITSALARLGEETACAVRSSATAEDLPSASFAGQQDTYLNIIGRDAILQHISQCWASLFTERAVTYRLRNGFDQRRVRMAVVVQRMILPEAAGVLFTGDPVTGNRKITSVEATFGLGVALVSGLVSPDVYHVRNGQIIGKTIAAKHFAILGSPAGGTRQQPVELERQDQPALTDAQVLRLAALGRQIEAHFGRPQDIEWCLADGAFHIVQSRPITTLFPIPETDDAENHVYLSVGHQQMMTDAMKPLGLSFWQMTTPRPMAEAGGRLFVDVAGALATSAGRAGLLGMAGRSDPLIADALQTLIDRDFIPLLPDAPAGAPAGGAPPNAASDADAPTPIETDPAIVADLIAHTQASIAALKRDIRTKSGTALLDFIEADIQELRRLLFDRRSHEVFMSAMDATWWLNEQLHAWLGETNAADVLTQSVPNNVTSEMGLALLDVADVIRPHPEVVAFLEQVENGEFLDELPHLPGGQQAHDAILAWLDRYGMRCVGEIDITRPRWSERPDTLLPLILGNVRNFEPGAAERRFEQGRREAMEKEQNLLERLRALPDGAQKAHEAKQKIDRVRTFIGYREYPKYGMISRYFIYKLALLEEAERLVHAHVLREKEDIFHLRFEELRDIVRTNGADDRIIRERDRERERDRIRELIRERKDAFDSYRTLTPPRVLTSEGEALSGAYRRGDTPAGALIGLPVSAGTIEGRARVILDLADADLDSGDILVTTCTDPSWTPVFVAIAGLVTEVGGVMTHGAVIAREYGLPAVVGVEHATRLIRDGQRIRVHGTAGYVEVRSDPPRRAQVQARQIHPTAEP